MKQCFFYFLGSGQREKFDLSSKASEENPILLSFLGFVNLYYWLSCAPSVHVSFCYPTHRVQFSFVSNNEKKKFFKGTSLEETSGLVIIFLGKKVTPYNDTC